MILSKLTIQAWGSNPFSLYFKMDFQLDEHGVLCIEANKHI